MCIICKTMITQVYKLSDYDKAMHCGTSQIRMKGSYIKVSHRERKQNAFKNMRFWLIYNFLACLVISGIEFTICKKKLCRNVEASEPEANSSEQTAIQVMEYHRDMANNFMAFNYIIGKIIYINKYQIPHKKMSKRLRNGPYVTKQRRFLEDFETFFHVSDSDSDTMNVTGYASYQKPHNLNRIQPLILKSATENNELNPIRKSRIGYNTIENSHSTQVLEELSSKEINLKDVMDIALTTLSFLSFGMFVLQILTFVTNENLDVNNIMLTHPVSTTFISGGDEIEEVRRKKRSSSKLLIPMKFDSLARRSLCLLDLYFNASGIHYPFYYSLITKYDEIMSNKLFDGIFLIPIWRFLQADKIHDEKYLH